MSQAVAPVKPESPSRVSFQGWLPAQEAADYLGVSREYVYRLKSIYDGGGVGIPGFMLGDKSRVLMFRVSDLDAYKRLHPDLGKHRSESNSPANETAPEAGDSPVETVAGT
jgi:excisionase family DNA binding protein